MDWFNCICFKLVIYLGQKIIRSIYSKFIIKSSCQNKKSESRNDDSKALKTNLKICCCCMIVFYIDSLQLKKTKKPLKLILSHEHAKDLIAWFGFYVFSCHFYKILFHFIFCKMFFKLIS